jgi:hypothetical protein
VLSLMCWSFEVLGVFVFYVDTYFIMECEVLNKEECG